MTLARRTVSLESGELPVLVGGDGPVVVLSHALGEAAWGPLSRLARACTVVVPEWLDASVDVRTRLSLGWWDPLLRELGQRSGALAVWSMAGPAGLYFAAEERDSLSHLVLVEPVGLAGFPSFDWRVALHALLSKIRGRPTRGLARALVRGWVVHPGVDRRPLEEAMQRFLADPVGGGGPPRQDDDEDAEDELDDEDGSLADDLADVRVPTLLIAGAHSDVCGPAGAEAARAQLPADAVLVFEESGHAPQLEQSGRFEEAVAELVRGR